MEMLKDQIQGLKQSIKTLRETERLFIKSQTLAEQVEKARSDMTGYEEDLEVTKEEKAAMRAEKFAMLKEACDPLAEKITSLLAYGEAVVTMEDELFIGWKHNERVTPYSGLSGGEKVFWDAAMSNALLTGPGQKILIIEAAEEDEETLQDSLTRILTVHPEAQVLLLTCHAPEEFPEGWKVVNL